MVGLKIKTKAKAREYGYSPEAVKLTAEAMNLSMEEAETVLKKLEDQERTRIRRTRRN
ncbi:MAG: hypothetical protein V4722_04365 [Bacteroidota bacterium]